VGLGRLLCTVVLWEAGRRRRTKGQSSQLCEARSRSRLIQCGLIRFRCQRGAWDSKAWQGFLMAFALFSVSALRGWSVFCPNSGLGGFSPPSPLPSFILLLSVKHRRMKSHAALDAGMETSPRRGLEKFLEIKASPPIPDLRAAAQPQSSRESSRPGEPT